MLYETVIINISRNICTSAMFVPDFRVSRKFDSYLVDTTLLLWSLRRKVSQLLLKKRCKVSRLIRRMPCG